MDSLPGDGDLDRRDISHDDSLGTWLDNGTVGTDIRGVPRPGSEALTG
jgi:hypothetical protein